LPEIVEVFEAHAVQHHYEILLAFTMNDSEHMKSSVRRMIERRVEGVAIMTFGVEDVLLEDLKLCEVPLVFVDVGPPRPRVSNISGPPKLRPAEVRQQAFFAVDERDWLASRLAFDR
jgi:DNA-binding LacI/PurR family transcriptional regulator